MMTIAHMAPTLHTHPEDPMLFVNGILILYAMLAVIGVAKLWRH